MVNHFARASNISIAEFQVYIVLTVQKVMLTGISLFLTGREMLIMNALDNRFLYMIIVAFPFLIGTGFFFPYNLKSIPTHSFY